MNKKIITGVCAIYVILISMFTIFMGGVAMAAEEQALTGYEYVSIKSQDEVIRENIPNEEKTKNKSAAAEEKSSQNNMYAAAIAALLVPCVIALPLSKKENED
ncbi:MAG: hypothetical protein ACI4QR_03085 [Eubacteriales bacterium]